MSSSSGEAVRGRLSRSLLFVPAGDERKMAKAVAGDADMVILDLEDSVAAGAKVAARAAVGAFLAAAPPDTRRQTLYVRVNDLGTGMTAEDLAAVLHHRPDGIMLPKANSGADVAALAREIDRFAGADAASMGIIAIATETPLALLQMHTFVGCSSRLKGLAWGAEDLGTALGVSAARDASGAYTPPFVHARNLCLITAVAAGVQPIDSVLADFRNEAGLVREAGEAARDGFTAKMAIHPAQVVAINAAFTPAPAQIAEAEAVVAAFAASPDAGVIAIEGRMFDRPHLERAKALLARVR